LIPYSFDGTAALKQMPGCVVLATTTEQVVAILKLANQTKTPVVTRGSGTGLSGGSLPVSDCIVLCLVKMETILELDRANLTMLVEAGVTTQAVSDAANAAGLLGAGVGGGFDAGGQSLGESVEVLDEDAAGIELGFHDGGLEEMVQRAAQAQPVQAGQNTCYGMTESVRKGRRDAGDGGRSLWVHPPNFYRTARRSATLVAAWPR
jgi:hypothetical protein